MVIPSRNYVALKSLSILRGYYFSSVVETFKELRGFDSEEWCASEEQGWKDCLFHFDWSLEFGWARCSLQVYEKDFNFVKYFERKNYNNGKID